MFKELLSLFRSHAGVASMSDGFDRMLDLTHRLTDQAGSHLFDGPPSQADREALRELDAQVNALARQIRRQVVAHLATGGKGAPYGLLLMSLVKDVEAMGDYARRLSGIRASGGAPLPSSGELVDDVRRIRDRLSGIYGDMKPHFAEESAEHARVLVDRAAEASRIADGLPARIAAGDQDAATTVTLLSAVFFYQRIAAHLGNVLSGVFLPLDQLDHFDEADLEEMERLAGESG